MVSTSVNIKLFDFQEQAVINLIDLTTGNHKQTAVVKSPTGSGKTIILINYICEYLDKISRDTAFIWLCPGKGDLEEQSRKKMIKFAPTKKAQSLQDALSSGFASGSTTLFLFLHSRSDNICPFGNVFTQPLYFSRIITI